MGRPIVLLTDFGGKDHYVGVMKGVIHSLLPDPAIIDLSHEVAPQDVVSAHILLKNAYPYFPRKSIFVAVVDPGVGTNRPIIGVETADHVFLAPDNGILGFLGSAEPIERIVQITNRKYFREPVSDTFHGRDIFAPVAAHLALGIPLGEMGPVRKDLKRLSLPGPVVSAGLIEGRVVSVDRFGNLVTDIPGGILPPKAGLTISVGKTLIQGLSKTYGSKKEREPLALVGSDGMIEIAVNRGNAAETLSIPVGSPVQIRSKIS